ncbi:unnamed protein product [Fraxinus pennsylvanica]|uniref:Glutamate synthase domain-containing protein n=1 Tax=Fraxinus pennsylvanica TaxID=56036 RepID=A0AAD2DK51_9LAMI|nr:unnamed protein product [Fraxinus pennsylvanica]
MSGMQVLRDLLEFKSDRSLIPIGRVEPASSIVKRFCTGGMSLGAISRETHEAITIAVNGLGGKHNLGEGGQLPGKKVSAYIARLRNSKPGVSLISPPPHHDIYSIKDLAQLIFDLHQVNPKDKVSIKLEAEAGIGTVASRVTKGNADIIQISGHDGGTGASPVSSIKHAGGPWDPGVTETHQTLIQNGLRERVILRVDGGFKSGFDVLIASIMGADEYGFGSIAMIVTGCVMARICHTNNCPVGVSSQREELRARFPGMPGDLVNNFLHVAEEVIYIPMFNTINENFFQDAPTLVFEVSWNPSIFELMKSYMSVPPT